MDSFADIINLWETAETLRQDLAVLGVDVSGVTVRSWRVRGIPGEYWGVVAEAASRRGFAAVTHEALCRIGDKRTAA